MCCSAAQELMQCLGLGSKNFSGGTESLCISIIGMSAYIPYIAEVLDLGTRTVHSLSFAVSWCPHCLEQCVQEVWAAWGSGPCLIWREECGKADLQGNPQTSRPRHVINLRTRRGARGRGAKRLWDKLQVSWNLFALPKCLCSTFNEILASWGSDIFPISLCAV